MSPLQRRILDLLAGFDPPWRLTGGAALAGFHLGHRTTRDLDLFFHGRSVLDTIPSEVESTLRAAGLSVRTEREAPGYRRYVVEDPVERTIVDVVAEPVPAVEPAIEASPGIFVDTRHEILVNKLTALLGRSAIRDLVDVGALLADGGDLDRAIVDAGRKDGGFSPPTLAWLLAQLPVEALAESSGIDPSPLLELRTALVKHLLLN
ncbi:MAG: nucleotidyl transferase AbiEii/AbiGii toxin family protein [Pseudomonadota bacterium]|nr:nucleotidyl transferase AbiEii/AbiGii toxin family protein [Pseudomonadota bacterium]